MGIDVSKLKVKKDSRDVQIKAQTLFKKATNAINITNKLEKVLQSSENYSATA